jgi:hypothetical protein
MYFLLWKIGYFIWRFSGFLAVFFGIYSAVLFCKENCDDPNIKASKKLTCMGLLMVITFSTWMMGTNFYCPCRDDRNSIDRMSDSTKYGFGKLVYSGDKDTVFYCKDKYFEYLNKFGSYLQEIRK